MRVLEGDYTKWSQLPSRTAVTIGVFDGVHLGHQSILAHLQDVPGAATSAVVTFREHPAAVVRPDSVPPMLTTLDQRIELFTEYGVGAVAVLEFDQVRDMDPEHFVSVIVTGVMNAMHVGVGRGFRFGHDMAGDAASLEALGETFGYSVELIDIYGGDSPVRSTAIREAIAAGQVEHAATMLGRPFQMRGLVVEGDRRGRQLGFPTANLELAPGWVMPQRGVYSAITRVATGEPHPSVVNVGIRPTFGGHAEVVEVHLLDADVELYGQQLQVDFVTHIRPEQRFNGVEALVEQIGRDVAVAAKDLAGRI